MSFADENVTPSTAVERARRGVRMWVRDARRRTGAGLKSATPYGILALMTASAVAPVAGAGLGASPEFAAALSQVGGLGTNYLAEVLAGAADRIRGREPSAEQWRDAIAETLLPSLQANDEHAQALRDEVGRLLQAVDAVSVALAESAGGDERLQQSLALAFGALGDDVGELRWMAADAARTLAVLQQEVAEQGRRQRQQLGVIRQSLVVLSQLRRDVLSGGRSAEPATATSVPGAPTDADVCPYPGMASFQPEDAQWFYGREPLVAELLGRLAEQLVGGPPLVVVGVSGVGKSSLLRAGLLPAIAGGGLGGDAAPSWPWLLMTPGSAPLAELVTRTAALADAGTSAVEDAIRDDPRRFGELAALAGGDSGRLIIVVDQFEELFTRCADPAERAAFVTALAGAAPALLVLAVRADFYAQCTELAPMAPMLAAGQVVLGPLQAGELRRAIQVPADRAGLVVQSGLVELLLTDLGALSAEGYQPGALPLLGHALRATWEAREAGTMTVAGYRETGGIQHAVAETAEHIYLAMDEDGRAALRAALLGLVAVADRRMVVRRQAGRDELDIGVLDQLVETRLVTVGRDVVEISHEALLTSWPRLAGWLVEAREEIMQRQRLAEAARDWATSGEDPDALYRGARLVATREWIDGGADLPDLQQRFVAASVAAAESAQVAQRRAARRLRRLVAGLAVALLLTVAGGVVALDQRGNAQEQRRQARSRQFAAEAQIAAGNDQMLSMRKALDAWGEWPTSEARGALLSAQMTNALGNLGTQPGGQAVAVSPDGHLVAIGYLDGVIRLWDTATLRQHGADLRHTEKGSVYSLAFSPDGTTLASGSVELDGVRVWDVADGRLRHKLPGWGRVAWLPDSTAVLASRSDVVGLPEFQIGAWDPASGRRTASIPSGKFTGGSLAISADGRYVAMAGTKNDAARVWRRSDGRPMLTIDDALQVAFAPDGTLVSSGWKGLRQWNVAVGRLVKSLPDSANLPRPPGRFAVTSDGALFALGDRPNTVATWRLSDGQQGWLFTGFEGNFADVGTSADGKMLAVTGTGAPPVLVRRAVNWLDQERNVQDVAIDSTGRRLATVSIEQPVRVWDLDRRVLIATHPQPAPGTSVAYGRDGTLASTASDGSVRVYDPAGRLRATLRTGDVQANEATFSPDGTLLAVAVTPPDSAGPDARTDPDVIIWDVATLRRKGGLTIGKFNAGPLAFTPDGARLLAVGNQMTLSGANLGTQAAIWTWRTSDLSNVSTHEVGQAQVFDIDVSPDGRRLALVGLNRQSEIRSLDGATVERTFGERTARVRKVAFSPDGRTLATAPIADPITRLWDLRTGTLTAQLTGHGDEINTAAFTPDGTTLATGSADASVALWQLDPEEAVRRLCRIVVPASGTDGEDIPGPCR